MSKILNQLRIVKRQIGAAEALLEYSKTRSEIASATEHLATLKARLSVLKSHFDYA
jgi:hypothetical protein